MKMVWPINSSSSSLAVLVSGGLDSAVMLGEATQRWAKVHPLYVRTGSYWEEVELGYLNRFLKKIATPVLQPLHSFDVSVSDVYGTHWSLSGKGIPDENSPDDAVFLPGRNILLLVKAMIWCHLNGIPDIVMATLEANPFPDATDEFFTLFTRSINLGIGSQVQVHRPYSGLKKYQVIQRGALFPLEESFSCIQPVQGLHCGRCNKCAERQQAFRQAQVADPTRYASPIPSEVQTCLK